MSQLNITNLITILDNTRFNGRSSSCIDNILTTFDENNFIAEIVNPGISDHYGQCLYLNLNIEKIKPQAVYRQEFFDYGIIGFKHSTGLTDMGEYYCSQDVNFLSSDILQKYKYIISFLSKNGK